MNKFIFKVKGSQPEPYKVTFEKDSDVVRAFCDCAAGKNGQACKHRNRIINGEYTDIVSSNRTDVDTVKSWYLGSELGVVQSEILKKEKDILKIEREITALKKKVSRLMMGKEK